ncbi:LacI family DNA-binding transcriptional regulator [Paenibacillus sp. ATY16]|uniref:LacI family DNA-binding transcriptional regulator n=1 Tax=Paenibacillus sp. ATY16 TaxID=1759312 RepID=UPI00200DDCF5|nr:LacI family DNA-binding transcriptional regulator [Paenibacillus sp. ATY16]MCK9858661.1 LacI family transcriptional regulator [Paenibacillus sp. ATY16]
MPVTLKDIAAELNISATTVSRALKDDARISKEVRDKVKRVSRKMGYRPNLMAKSLVSNRTDTIGFLVDNLSWSFFSELAEYVQNAAEQLGYSVFIYSSQKSWERERAGVERFLSRGIDGLLVFATEMKENFAYYEELSELGIPVLFFNHFNHMNVNCVTTDDYDGACKAMRHLLDLGHRKIGYIGSKEDSSFKRQRLRAYSDMLAEVGVTETSSRIALEEDDPLYGYRVSQKWFKPGAVDKPTAIFAQNDMLAFGAIRAIMEAGLRVPEDVSVIGFDDLDACECLYPPLTTVKIPLKRLAEAAVRFLSEQIGDGRDEDDARLKTTISPNLVIRQSTAHAKGE